MSLAQTFAHVDLTVCEHVMISRETPCVLVAEARNSLDDLLECPSPCFVSQVADDVPCTVIFGIEEAVKEAQNGGSGVVIYFRKEGRALGEVTKVSSIRTCIQLSHHTY